MLSKNQIKLITSLQQKKYRFKNNLFVVEGKKTVDEFLQSDYELEKIYSVDNSFAEKYAEKFQLITEIELKKISAFKNPNKVLALFKITETKPINTEGLIIALDEVNDPGNLGTIIRLCDWFGIKQIVCSENTVDCYNSKVVQSTMGSLTRVAINYVNLTEFLLDINTPIYGAFMDGKNVYKTKLQKEAILVMGNEANGISKQIETIITNKVSIPRFGSLQKTESLNVATATAIFLSEFKRD